MKRRLFSVGMLVLVAVLMLVMPVAAGGKPPEPSMTVGVWTHELNTDPTCTEEGVECWWFSASDVNWQGYPKAYFIDIGIEGCETRAGNTTCQNHFNYSGQYVNKKTNPYPQHLDMGTESLTLKVPGTGVTCTNRPFVVLEDAKGKTLAIQYKNFGDASSSLCTDPQ